MMQRQLHDETKLEMALRHVREAEEKVAHQERIVRELQAHGHDSTQAEKLLMNFREILDIARAHLALERQE
jgi:hypothetical protein